MLCMLNFYTGWRRYLEMKNCKVRYLPLVQEFYELHAVETGRIPVANIPSIFSVLIPFSRLFLGIAGKVSGRRVIPRKGELWKIPDVYPQAMSERRS